MEWSIDTYIRDNPENLNGEDLVKIQVLPEIRNQVFFPDYEQYGYISQEPLIVQLDAGGINSLKLGLISVTANRLLSVRYTWFSQETQNKKDGLFSELIFILNEESGWDNTIYLDIIAKKRFNVDLGKRYQDLMEYPGNFEEKSIACLRQIKYNYDTYARDIISGENWDRNAWKDPRDD
jgi:hypothetical protein